MSKRWTGLLTLFRMDQMLGDELSRSLLDLTTSGNLQASPAHNASYSSGFPQGKNMLVIHRFAIFCWINNNVI